MKKSKAKKALDKQIYQLYFIFIRKENIMAEQLYKRIEFPITNIDNKIDCMIGISKIFLDFEFTNEEKIEILESMLILNKNNI